MLADFKAVANEQTQVKKDILKVLVASIVPLMLFRMFISLAQDLVQGHV
jgi:hypothetical protein